MAGKRCATSDLNHDNWDRDEDVEEAGTFQKASDDVLKRRVIKTAKRRNAGGSSVDSEDGGATSKPVFGGFTAFSSFAPPNPNAAFSFLNNSNTVKTPPSSNAPAAKPSTPSISLFSTGLTNGVEAKSEKTAGKPTKTTEKPIVIDDTGKEEEKKDEGDERSEYFAKLKGLNESVLSWIEKHVKENPFINLKPVFTDYERYLTDLEMKHVTVNAETKKELAGFSFKSPSKTVSPTVPTPTKTNTFGGSKDADITPKASPFSSAGNSLFGSTTPSVTGKITFDIPSPTPMTTVTKEDAEKEKPSFVFGSANAAKSVSADTKPFSHLFGAKPASAPFSFGAPAASAPSPFAAAPLTSATPAPPTEVAKDDDEDEPPKVEFTPVVEEDHIYTIRCKVFVKKDGSYADRGVGNLFLKKVPDSEKVQLIVRADTNLGNLLCNLLLSAAVPTQRMGKKDVMLVCIPTPDEKPPPVPVLLRVKSSEEADALLKELDKHRQ